jgi:uncharacterized repeat protein (TIGR03803 family)
METQTPAATTSRNRARSFFSSTSLKIALLLILAAAQFGQAQTYQVIYNFNGGATGQNPAAGMILDSNGNLYGTTSAGGGAAGEGIAFELSRSGSG